MENSSPKNKKFQKTKKTHSEKSSYILGNRTFSSKTKKLFYFFLYFRRELVKSEKQKFLIFF